MGARPTGFSFRVRGSDSDAEVAIDHYGRPAGTLRGRRAAEFLDAVSEEGDESADQELMARLTGNYRHGNERTASEHPRNRDQRRRR